MTQAQQHTNSFTQQLRELPALIVVVIIALISFTVMFWYTTSSRINELESQLAELNQTLELRLPKQNWRFELERAVKGLEQRITSTNTTGFSKGQYRAARGSETDELVESQRFKDGLQSLYRSLDLSPERRSELGSGLKDMLASIWPDYIAYSTSSGVNSAEFQSLYCSKAKEILTGNEVARLGCK